MLLHPGRCSVDSKVGWLKLTTSTFEKRRRLTAKHASGKTPKHSWVGGCPACQFQIGRSVCLIVVAFGQIANPISFSTRIFTQGGPPLALPPRQGCSYCPSGCCGRKLSRRRAADDPSQDSPRHDCHYRRRRAPHHRHEHRYHCPRGTYTSCALSFGGLRWPCALGRRAASTMC